MATIIGIHPRLFRDLEVQVGVSTQGVLEPCNDKWLSIQLGGDQVTFYHLSTEDIQDIATKIVGGLMELQRGPLREEDELCDLGATYTAEE